MRLHEDDDSVDEESDLRGEVFFNDTSEALTHFLEKHLVPFAEDRNWHEFREIIIWQN